MTFSSSGEVQICCCSSGEKAGAAGGLGVILAASSSPVDASLLVTSGNGNPASFCSVLPVVKFALEAGRDRAILDAGREGCLDDTPELG